MKTILRDFEDRLTKMLVDKLLASGFKLSVDHERGYDPGNAVWITDSSQQMLDEISCCDEEHIMVWSADDLVAPLEDFEDGVRKAGAWIYLVYGNDGYDLISDYSTNLEPYLKEINDFCREYDG